MTARIESFTVASLPAAPWRNGGGVTREIVRTPADADLDAFDWRVSMADLSIDGSFSSFPGVDRVIVLLEGAGIHMRSRDGMIDHRLAAPLVPYIFRGDAIIDATLIVGPSRDFNVMTRRSAVRGELRIVREPDQVATTASGVLYAARGRWRVNDATGRRSYSFAPGAGVWWDDHPIAWELTSSDTDPALIVVSVTRVP